MKDSALYDIFFYCKRCHHEWSEELWIINGRHPLDLTEYECRECDGPNADAANYHLIRHGDVE
jgi:hypothetical protein